MLFLRSESPPSGCLFLSTFQILFVFLYLYHPGILAVRRGTNKERYVHLIFLDRLFLRSLHESAPQNACCLRLTSSVRDNFILSHGSVAF